MEATAIVSMLLVQTIESLVEMKLRNGNNPCGSLSSVCLALPYQGTDIVFRFIIEYSSLMDFGP
jgi:hypothetical protein